MSVATPVKPKVYLETTIPSYLAARPSRDLHLLANQQVTRDWWRRRRAFDLFISQTVIEEVSAGDPEAAGRRLAFLDGLPILDASPDAYLLATELVGKAALPAKAATDALHISIAVVNGMDFLLTWNCTHIANATLRGKIEFLCRLAGYSPTIICTPLELPGEVRP